ncbi:hypothetical protein JMJ35_003705 [Cladonia borealis]|uniref:Uncharacterized protein n=1 Tax=Cladonia borealis TaxID=184061 RepID=A0AA39R620_9LECA|nr:hypothetical protein JMJ35_003705 [Cladonia borealis]
MAQVIAVAAGVVTMFQFLQGLFPSTPVQGSTSHIRIGVGLDGTFNGSTLSDSDGAVKGIRVYNEDKILIGTGKGDGVIPSGSFQDISIDQSKGKGQQPTYLQLNAGTDALCIAYITQQWPDGTQRGWSGDMGRQCNQAWAYSNIIIDDSNYKPDCTWLDQDHSNGISAAAVQIHMEYFTNTTSNYSQDPSFYCSSPVLLFEYDNYQTGAGDNFWTSKRRVKQRDTPVKRIRPRSAAMNSSIVSSTDPSHSAVKLCDSDTSYGPDFVSLSEGIFCDMATKTPWPLCSESVADNCYDWDSHTLINGAGQTVKGYTDVQEWR